MTNYEVVNAPSRFEDYHSHICPSSMAAVLLQFFMVRTQKLTQGGCSDGLLQLSRGHPAGC